jgi:carbon-monoxide dehydrogenase large subunit
MDVGLNATATYVAPVQNFPNGCHVCELEIDEETGSVEIVRYSVVDDVGTVINPLLLKGQIVGGVAQGVGQILMEDIQFDGDGQILTGSFMDYAMPRAVDSPDVTVVNHPVPATTNVLGVKGCGEAGCAGSLTSVMNAVADALSEFGIRHMDMPATPHRVWRAIQDARAARPS